MKMDPDSEILTVYGKFALNSSDKVYHETPPHAQYNPFLVKAVVI